MKNLLIRQNVNIKNYVKFESFIFCFKFIVQNQKFPISIRYKAFFYLSTFLKKASSVFFKNNCFLTGRLRGYSRFFGLSRIQIRQYARLGLTPNVSKYNW